MKRILIVKLSSLGDVVHALPAAQALADRTGAVLDWVVQPEYVPLVSAVGCVSRVLAFPRRHTLRRLPGFLRELRQEPYDWIVDLQGLLKSAWTARFARGTRRVGPAWAREGAHFFYDLQPPRHPGPRRHAVDELMDVVSLLVPSDSSPRMPHLDLGAAETDGRPGPHVAFAPFSRWATKNWPLDKFAELGRRLVAEMGCHISIVGGPDDQARGNSLAVQIGNQARNACGQTDLLGLCRLLKGMDLLVSVDSGPMHWADALGVPLVAVFGATDPARTGPYGQLEHVVVKSGLSCRPCHSRTCARGDLACLRTLEVDAVLCASMARL